MRRIVLLSFLLTALTLSGCGPKQPADTPTPTPTVTVAPTESVSETYEPYVIVNTGGTTVETRFNPPRGYVREDLTGFGQWLRTRPVRQDGAKVFYHTGDVKDPQVQAAVLDVDFGRNINQKGPNAFIRLYAEYVFSEGRQKDLSFLLYGFDFVFDYATFSQGYRFNESKKDWQLSATPADDEETLKRYLSALYPYSFSHSLLKVLLPAGEVTAGAVYLEPNTAGLLVVDTAYDPISGRRVMLLAQSGAKAQDIHIVRNDNEPEISPWFAMPDGTLYTPDMNYSADALYVFP